MRRTHQSMIVAVAALIAALLLGGCSDDEKEKTTTLGTLTFNDHGTKDARGKADMEFEADSNYFSPTFLRGNAGQTLTLRIENESSALHNFSLPAQQLDQDLPAKSKAEVRVTFPPSGVVRFFCKIHAGQGMNGELLTGDASPQAVSGDTAPPSPGQQGTGSGYP